MNRQVKQPRPAPHLPFPASKHPESSSETVIKIDSILASIGGGASDDNGKRVDGGATEKIPRQGTHYWQADNAH